MAAISYVAIKTRKVRIKLFRDARKVNGLLFMMIVLGIFSVILYRLLDDNQYRLQADIVLHVAHSSVVILCQGFLFLPKILPVICKKWRLKLSS